MEKVNVIRRKKKWKTKKGTAYAKKDKWKRKKRRKGTKIIKDKKPTTIRLRYTRDEYGRLVPKKTRNI